MEFEKLGSMELSAIIELGQLFKTKNRYWTYGRLEKFVEDNYKYFMNWWRLQDNDYMYCDTDQAVEFWWSIIGKNLEVNDDLTNFKLKLDYLKIN